jgi:hypothetical protein
MTERGGFFRPFLFAAPECGLFAQTVEYRPCDKLKSPRRPQVPTGLPYWDLAPVWWWWWLRLVVVVVVASGGGGGGCVWWWMPSFFG